MVQGQQRLYPTRRAILGTVAVAVAAPAILRAQSSSIKIGFPLPLTGPYGTEAADQVRCAQLAVDEFNAAGGLDGRKAELLSRDDRLDPGEAATRAIELIEKDGVNFMVGSLSASVQLAINNVCKERVQLDQPVRSDHRHARLEPLYLPRGDDPASDRRRRRSLRLR